MSKDKTQTLTARDQKKAQAYDLLQQINAHLATARELQAPHLAAARELQQMLAKVEAEIAELEKADSPETPKEKA